jgi:hypothetical protein
MSLQKQLGLLRDECIEALESKNKTSTIVSNRVQSQLNSLNHWDIENVNSDIISLLYNNHKKEFLEGNSSWPAEAKLVIDDINITYCFSIALEVDKELANIILYRIYRCVETADILEKDDEKIVSKRSVTIKSSIDGGSSLPPGPTGIEMGALQQNLGSVIQGFLPMFEGLMQSSEFKTLLNKTVPKDTGDGSPPDVSSVIKNTLEAFDSDEGKSLFNKITGVLGQLPKK